MIGNIPAQNEWEAVRLGKFTGSRMNDLTTEPKLKADKEAGNLSATAYKYIMEKLAEFATGTTRQVSTYATEWGNEYEPEAAYEIKKRYPDFEYLGKETQKFFPYTDFSGGSPDGYSAVAKLVGEIKCPENPANHTAYVLFETQEDLAKAEPAYYSQIQFNMMCVAKFLGCDFKEMKGLFVSYCPMYEGDFEHLKYKELAIEPDMEFHDKVIKALAKAEKHLADLYCKMTTQSILITGDTIQGQSVLIAEQIK